MQSWQSLVWNSWTIEVSYSFMNYFHNYKEWAWAEPLQTTFTALPTNSSQSTEAMEDLTLSLFSLFYKHLYWLYTSEAKRNGRYYQKIHSTTFQIPPLQVHQACTVMCIRPGHHQHMKKLVTVPRNIKFSRFPPFWNSCCINQGPNSIKHSHQDLIPGCVNRLRLIPVQDKFVQNRGHTWYSHPEKERGTNCTKFRILENREERNDDCGYSQKRNKSHVEIAQEGIAHEGVVNGWVKWCGN